MFRINLFEEKDFQEIAQLISDYFQLDYDRVLEELGVYSGVDYDVFDFIEKFEIDLEKLYRDDSLITCRHALATDDNAFAFLKEKGLLNLKVMLEDETPLSTFLLEHGIKVNVEEKILELDGKKYPILDNNTGCKSCIYEEYQCKDFISNEPILRGCEYRSAMGLLHTKLYYDQCQTECFIDGFFKDIYNYNSIRNSPEILSTINDVTTFLGQKEDILKEEWGNKKNTNFYILEFEVPMKCLENVSIKRMYDSYYEVSDIIEKYGYDYEDFSENRFSKEINSNLFVIKTLMDLSYVWRYEKYAQLKTSTVIKGESIRVIRKHDVKTSSIEEQNR